MYAALPLQAKRLFPRIELVTPRSLWSNLTVAPRPTLFHGNDYFKGKVFTFEWGNSHGQYVVIVTEKARDIIIKDIFSREGGEWVVKKMVEAMGCMFCDIHKFIL